LLCVKMRRPSVFTKYRARSRIALSRGGMR
jgi:hypothetical protein